MSSPKRSLSYVALIDLLQENLDVAIEVLEVPALDEMKEIILELKRRKAYFNHSETETPAKKPVSK